MSMFGGYSLAIRRNRVGQTSSRAAVALIAGEPLSGGFKDKSLVTKFEYLLEAACRVRSHHFYADVEAAHIPRDRRDAASHPMLLDVGVGPGGPAHPRRQQCGRVDGRVTSIEVFHYTGDATNSDAICKNKMHLGTFGTLVCPHGTRWLRNDVEDFDLGNFSKNLMMKKDPVDMQIVNQGTGEELYSIIERQITSVSGPEGPTVARRVREAHTNPGRVSVYVMNLDNGPDNQCATRLIRQEISGTENVASLVCWCTFHQYHLIIKDVIGLLDNFQVRIDDLIEVEEAGAEALALQTKEAREASAGMPGKYFSLVASVCNVWRSAGVPKRIRDVAFNTCKSSAKAFARIPGRPLRGRWGCLDEIEGLLVPALPTAGKVFQRLFPVDLSRARAGAPQEDEEDDERRGKKNKGKRVTSIDDENQEYTKKMKKYRRIATIALNSAVFRSVVRLSHAIKAPLAYYFRWAQKQVKTMNDEIAQCKRNDQVYVGHTALSLLVESVAGQTYNLILSYLGLDSIRDEATGLSDAFNDPDLSDYDRTPDP